MLASAPVAELFTQQELEELQRRASELATEHEADAALRVALQLFAETAGNLVPLVPKSD